MIIYGISVSVNAQNLPYSKFQLLKGDTLEFQLNSNGYGPIVISSPANGEINNLGIGSGANGTSYNLKYFTYDTNFVGTDHAVLEYFGNPGSDVFTWHKKVIVLDFEILNSIIEANSDFYNVNFNSTGDTLDIVLNDSTTGDSLFLENIINVNNGSVQILPENKVVFIPKNGFEGKTYFNYEIRDELGSKDIGHVIIDVKNSVVIPDTLSYYVTNTNKLSIVLNELGFSLNNSDSPKLGELDLNNYPEIIYTPYVDSVGIDQFSMVNSNDTIIIIVNVVEGREDGNVLVDDDVYTGMNTSISFNVKDNDFKKNYFQMSYTQPSNGSLSFQGQGKFTYTPDDNFYGVDKFVYTAQLSFQLYQSATVYLYVNNFEPEYSLPYYMNTSKNSELVLSYEAPIEGYSFNLVSAPLDGTISIYPGLDTVFVNCGDIIGNDLIVYTPNNDFVGGDRFEVEYCPPNDNCKLIKVNVNVLEELSDTTCPCASYNCVWPGDSDNNGKVNVKDILPIAYYMGSNGSERTFNTTNWLGLNVTDWNGTQNSNGLNLKHSDTDGDGVITENDSLEVVDFYNNTHNLFTDLIVKQPDYPVYLFTEQDTVDIGDTMHLSIFVGDEDFPARDLNGISYTLVINPNEIDSSSLHHRFLTDSWLANASASVQLSNQYQDGQLDAVFSRIGFSGITGIGLVAKSDYIVEDDLEGTKGSFNKYGIFPMTIKMKNIVGMNGAGHSIGFPDNEIVVIVRRKGFKPSNIPEILIYPNPVNSLVNISIIGNEKISKYNIFNSMGTKVSSNIVKNTKAESIDVSNYSNGIYFIEIFTDKNNRIVNKIEVINR